MPDITPNSSTKPASSWNPFQGTVKTGKTSRDKIQAFGVTIAKQDSFGSFALRKIYNSITCAPGHALLACGRFFRYLDADNNSSQVPTEESSVPTEESSFKQVTDYLDPTRTLHNLEQTQKDLFILDSTSMEVHNAFMYLRLPKTQEQLQYTRNEFLNRYDPGTSGPFAVKLNEFYNKYDLSKIRNKEPETHQERKDARELLSLYKDCLDQDKTDKESKLKHRTGNCIINLIPPSFLDALKVKES